jgi:hypothetical protein
MLLEDFLSLLSISPRRIPLVTLLSEFEEKVFLVEVLSCRLRANSMDPVALPRRSELFGDRFNTAPSFVLLCQSAIHKDDASPRLDRKRTPLAPFAPFALLHAPPRSLSRRFALVPFPRQQYNTRTTPTALAPRSPVQLLLNDKTFALQCKTATPLLLYLLTNAYTLPSQ